MADGTSPSSYDGLFVIKALFFLALVLMCNLVAVTALYTFMLEKPFHQVLSKERAAFGHTLNSDLHETMRYSGDLFYDSFFVRTGIESVAYNNLLKSSENDVAGGAVKELKVFGHILDNLFDYFLLLSHRAGYLLVTMTYVGCLILAIGIHGGVIRHRKRYGFGDTPLLMNVWARATLAYSIPLTIIVWSLPFALNPYVLTGSLAFCVLGLAVFSFSLPKIA